MRYTTNLPSTIKGKITALQLAEREDPDDAVDWARYCLERTILTHLKRAERGSGTLTYDEAMEALSEAVRAAVEAADNHDGAPVEALKEMAADIDSLIDTGLTRRAFNDMKALYEGAKLAGMVG